MWKSRISWRIALAVFATIAVIQGSVLVSTLANFENGKLDDLQSLGRAALAPAMQDVKDQLSSPIAAATAREILRHTIVQGFTVYALDHAIVDMHGAPTLLKPSTVSLPAPYRSVDGLTYEVLLIPSDIGRPYYVAARLDSSRIPALVKEHIKQSVIIMLLLSGFVTSVLMIALGQWLLEPIMVLRHNLLSAARNPEKPELRRPKTDSRDEIGVALRIANDLIRQNAQNLKQLRTQAEDRIHKLAYFDALTGLPNRTSFLEKLDETIRTKVTSENKRLAVLSVDLDHFKDINDTMGHEIGDKLLDAVGKRLVKAVCEDCVVARVSADEFTIMTMLDDQHPDSSTLVEKIFVAMAEPISLLQERFQVRVSIGVSHCPDDGVDGALIMKNADIALNRAKEEGRDTVRYYSQDFDRAVQQRFQMLRDLRVAVAANQLTLHYHPQFDLRTGQMCGAEVLLRWWRPDNSKEGGKFVSPAEFIPVAEQSGLIVPIGEWVLKTACATNKMWQEKGLPPFRIAVNISGIQFHRSDIVSIVAAALQETGLDPKWLELEVTESVFMENMQVAIDILNQLHQQGVELAVDDFGTGYSSLSYLRQFPIDRLKIDQSFTRNALINDGDKTITKTIITLGHSLGLKVIAEGVETADHENFLKEHGCDEVQGFKYTKPIPAEKFWDFAIAYNRNLAKNAKLSVIDGAAS